MRRLLAVAGLLLLYGCGEPAKSQQVGPPPLYCNRSFTVNSLGATSIAQVVAGVANQAIHICGYDITIGAAAATYQLTVGTGVNCNANTVNITPAFALPANGGLSSRPGFAWFSSAQGAQLCHTITGTGPVTAVVSYGQY
jgi:hypothetical protein